MNTYEAFDSRTLFATYDGGCYEPLLFVHFEQIDEIGTAFRITVEWFGEGEESNIVHLFPHIDSMWGAIRWFEENVLDQQYTLYLPSRRF